MKAKKIEIKFTTEELELLQALAGMAMMDKDVSGAFGMDMDKRVALNNKLMYLLIESKKTNK